MDNYSCETVSYNQWKIPSINLKPILSSSCCIELLKATSEIEALNLLRISIPISVDRSRINLLHILRSVEMSNADSEDLYQIALLIDQLKHDDVQLRVTASKGIIQIARALGPERTRDELIPFLSESVDDEDEVLIVIADKLGELVNYVGGNDHIYNLLHPLELLICGEESAVRNKALISIESVVERMSNDHICKYFEPLLVKLASKDWFTSRSSAASLIHLAFIQVSTRSKSEFRSIFLRLCADETPSVRRVAAQNIVNMISKIVRSYSGVELVGALNDLIEAFKSFSQDEQDSIRIQVTPICIAMASYVTMEVKAAQIVPTVLLLSSDRSWRVRWSLANKLHELLATLLPASAADEPTIYSSIVNSTSGVFESLLNDTEPEVRAAAAAHLSHVCRFLQKSILMSKIIPSVQRLSTDSSEFVRAYFANEVNHLAPLIGREETVQLLLPILLQLLRDEASEVRLNVISSLEAINKVIGIELLSQSLLPAIVELAEDNKWRVRLAVIEHIPMIGKQLGLNYFNDKLVALCVSWLSDDVYSIRKAAAENLSRLTELFGAEWAKDHIIPSIDKMRSNTSFAQRMTCLFAIQVMLKCIPTKQIEQIVLPITLALTNDPVANVRFTVAKTLQLALSLSISEQQRADVINALSALSSDGDRDVRFYAASPANRK
eukprot:gene8912-12020_t